MTSHEHQAQRQGSAELTFAALRAASVARLPLFKNRHGEPAHSQPDGSDWSLGEWCNAVLGELGEAANLIKKVQRADVTLDEARPLLAREYADVVTYLDILAFRSGVDLGEITALKWDEVSARVGAPLRMAQFLDAPATALAEDAARLRETEDYADALQGQVDGLAEWQRRVCELLTPEGDRGALSSDLAEARIWELLRVERSKVVEEATPAGDADAALGRTLREALAELPTDEDAHVAIYADGDVRSDTGAFRTQTDATRALAVLLHPAGAGR